MEDIKTILKENDIVGVVCLHTPGFSEYLNHLETTYSCAKIEPVGVYLKLDSDKVGMDKAIELAANTYNMITHINNYFMSHAPMYDDAYKQLKKKWNGEDGPVTHSSHSQQNN